LPRPKGEQQSVAHVGRDLLLGQRTECVDRGSKPIELAGAAIAVGEVAIDGRVNLRRERRLQVVRQQVEDLAARPRNADHDVVVLVQPRM
jgi:hypothetical protein